MKTLEELRTNLADSARQLGGDELELLAVIAARLVMGARQYGALSLDTDDRDWNREAEEELADAMVYRAARLVVKRRREQEPHQQALEVMGMDLRVKEALTNAGSR